jgi:hypothetical protein
MKQYSPQFGIGDDASDTNSGGGRLDFRTEHQLCRLKFHLRSFSLILRKSQVGTLKQATTVSFQILFNLLFTTN